jgi:hypothetical protein
MTLMKKELAPSALMVDLENFRIGDHDNPREAYKAMIEEEREDLVNLADDIILNGLSPAERFIVCPDQDHPKQYIVCEGNRRLTAIKLLENPALAGETALHSRFVKLAKEYAKNPIKTISCVVMPDKQAALLWIERKHLDLGGRGIAKWGSAATSRADAARGRIRASKAVLEYLRANKLLDPGIEKILEGRLTNLDRVLQMPYMSTALGVDIAKDGKVSFANNDSKAGGQLLKRMVASMAKKEFSVNDIRSKEDRRGFIDAFSDGSVVKEEDDSSQKTSAPEKSGKPTKRARPSPLDRKTLALKGKDVALSISSEKLNLLYIEAKKINADELPNSAAILTRVFLEQTTDYFLIKKKVPLPQYWKDKGKTRWPDIGIPLKDKVAEVLKVLDPSKKDPAFKEVRKAQSNQEVIHSIESLHDFIHGLGTDADGEQVKRIWGRWHPYFEAVFDLV